MKKLSGQNPAEGILRKSCKMYYQSWFRIIHFWGALAKKEGPKMVPLERPQSFSIPPEALNRRKQSIKDPRPELSTNRRWHILKTMRASGIIKGEKVSTNSLLLLASRLGPENVTMVAESCWSIWKSISVLGSYETTNPGGLAGFDRTWNCFVIRWFADRFRSIESNECLSEALLKRTSLAVLSVDLSFL